VLLGGGLANLTGTKWFSLFLGAGLLLFSDSASMNDGWQHNGKE
jgi:hypothetical protein